MPYPSLHGWRARGAEEPRGMTRLVEGNGFEIEGTLRRFALRAGEYADVLAMARLR